MAFVLFFIVIERQGQGPRQLVEGALDLLFGCVFMVSDGNAIYDDCFVGLHKIEFHVFLGRWCGRTCSRQCSRQFAK